MINLKEVLNKYHTQEKKHRLMTRTQKLNPFELKIKRRFQECRWEPDLTPLVYKMESLLYLEWKGVRPDIKSPEKQMENLKQSKDKMDTLMDKVGKML